MLGLTRRSTRYSEGGGVREESYMQHGLADGLHATRPTKLDPSAYFQPCDIT